MLPHGDATGFLRLKLALSKCGREKGLPHHRDLDRVGARRPPNAKPPG